MNIHDPGNSLQVALSVLLREPIGKKDCVTVATYE